MLACRGRAELVQSVKLNTGTKLNRENEFSSVEKAASEVWQDLNGPMRTVSGVFLGLQCQALLQQGLHGLSSCLVFLPSGSGNPIV